MGNNSIDRLLEESALGIGEFEPIERFFLRSAARARAPESVLLGIGDDAALLRVPVGSDLVAAVDTIVAGRHFLFEAEARGIATAAMDVSDGLVGDLPKLAAASRVSAEVEVDRLPLSRAMREFASPQQARDWALAAGDDYELLLALPPDRFGQLAEAAARLGLALTAIGEVGPGSGVTWVLNGQQFDPRLSGYDHFR